MSERWEWVEIIEPTSKEKMYANLATGECVWDPPSTDHIKETDANQWWELYDQNTSRFYYYNATSQKTVWHRPQNCDIIPLAKLQTLKQNTEAPEDKELQQIKQRKESATQTPLPTSVYHQHHYPLQGKSQSHRDPEPPADSWVNGGRVLQSSQSSEAAVRHLRKEGSHDQPVHGPYFHHVTSHSPRQAVDSTAAADLHRALDLQASKSVYPPSSRQHAPPLAFVRQESLPVSVVGIGGGMDGYAREVHFGYQDVSQITTVQVTPRPKPKAFPRTNPAFSVSRRDGAPSYKRVTAEPHPPTAIYNQRFYDHQRHHHHPVQAPLFSLTSSIHAPPANFITDLSDRGYQWRDRMDSDSSHSSYGMSHVHSAIDSGIGGMTDSLYSQQSQHSDNSQGSLPSTHQREHSGSSQGSGRGLGDGQSSLRSSQEHHASLHNESLPPRRLGLSQPVTASSFINRGMSKGTAISPSQMFFTQAGQGRSELSGSGLGPMHTPQAPPRLKHKQKFTVPTSHSSQNSQLSYTMVQTDDGFDNRSADSVSVGEVSLDRQDTPSSIRSKSTQDSEDRRSEARSEPVLEESDNNSVVSNPSPLLGIRPSPLPKTQHFTQHASLRKKRNPRDKDPREHKKDNLQHNLQLSQPRIPLSSSMSFSHARPAQAPTSSTKTRLHSESDIEGYAVQFCNNSKGSGIFRKVISVQEMLSWTKDVIQKPMIKTNDKVVKKDAPEIFRLVQCYMGDRKTKQLSSAIALDLAVRGWTNPNLRDEIYIQICRQTKENPKIDSLALGWELLAILLFFFPPSQKFHSYLEGFIYRHLDPTQNPDKVHIAQFAAHCQRRLDRISQSGSRKGLRKPSTDEVEHARKSLFSPSMFGSALDDIMLMQRDRYPNRQLPWIQTVLSEEVLRLDGARLEGIFRVPGDVDEVNALKMRLDRWEVPPEYPDPHIPASLLKQWYRELHEPLIPAEFYEQCVTYYEDPDKVLEIVSQLPHLNRLVLSYLIRFLQVFAAEENVAVTKMDANNLAMVWGPNCLRCEHENPSIILENTRKEMSFLRTLIINLDTSFMDGVF